MRALSIASVRNVPFTTTGFTTNGVSVTPNNTTSPDGRSTAYRVLETTANDYHFLKRVVGTFATGVPYIIEAYIKPINRQWVYMDNAFTATGYFDVVNGVVGNLGSAVVATKIKALRDGWYYIAMQFVGANVGDNFAVLSVTANGGALTFAGNAANGFYLWKAAARVGILHDAVSAPGGATGGEVPYIQQLGFESASNTFVGLNVEAISGGATRNTSIVKYGTASCRFYINRNDVGYGGGSNPHRAEIHSLESEYEFNQDYWFGFSQYYQNWTSDPAAEQIWQFHNVPNFGAGETWGTLKLQTPFGCQVQNNRFLIKHAVNNTASDPNSSVTVSTIDIGAVTSNVWVDWVIHARFHYSTGIIEVWKDGVLVYTKTGNTYYNDETGPYHKMGVYKWSWVHPQDNSVVDERTMFIDDWRIAKGAEVVYSDVAPRSN